MSGSKTLLDKVWDLHVVADLGDGFSLLFVDRNFVHDLGSETFLTLRAGGRTVRHPQLTFAVPDHGVSTAAGRRGTTASGQRMLGVLRQACAATGVRLLDLDSGRQGIVHVVGPELGLSLPGSFIVCCDSHTCTQGGLGALAFGIGLSEVVHVLATQTVLQKRPRSMRVNFERTPPAGTGAKDLMLYLIGKIGAAGGDGYAVEYAGESVRRMGIEQRLTLCNLSVELGAKIGMIAPDDTTYQYLAGRPFAPAGMLWEHAVQHWRTLPSEPEAEFDRELSIACDQVAPQITWGTSPEHVIGIDGRIPDPSAAASPAQRRGMEAALAYMDLRPGDKIEGTKIDWVFIGSCANSRLSDLRDAAAIARGHKVASGVHAWVIAGSEAIKREAEAEGLDRIFKDAGFEWREPGCSMCLAANGETVPSGQRCVSTSNRNFVGRQGPGARTHLASPAMAAAAAMTGTISDVRRVADVRRLAS